MAASNPVANSHSPRSSGDGAALNSPKSRRAARAGASPWTQIVRGGESESVPAGGAAPSSPSSSGSVQEQIANASPDWPPSKASEVDAASSAPPAEDEYGAEAQLESSDNGSGSNAGKRPAWNKPSNGAVEVSPVMGAVSWPALSESTKASPKSASSDSLKILSDGSLPASQGTGSASSSSHNQVTASNANPNSTPNHATPTRQRSMKRGSGGTSSGGVSANGSFPQPPPPSPPPPQLEMPPNNSGKPGFIAGESSSRDHSHKEAGQRGGFGSQSPSGSDHQQQRNSFKRGASGPHPRRDGSYHHSYVGRGNPDSGNQDWNTQRNFGGRDTHIQQQRVVPRGFVRRPQHTSAPFIPPPPVSVRPFGNPMVYPDVTSPVIYVQGPPPESLRSMPMVTPMSPHAMFFPVPDPQLHSKIVNQIDYYFSNENLIKDTFLRQNMDDQGWVPIKLIAGFKKVMHLSDNIQLILDSMRSSTVVEVQGDKVRKRNDWMRWIMPQVPFSPVSSPQSVGRPSHDMLAAHLQSVTLGETTTKHGHAEMLFSRSLSGEFSSQSQQSGSEDPAYQVTVQAGFERSMLAGNSSK